MKEQNRRNHRHQFNQPNHSSDCGFTLVELLVVVTIVSILSVSSVIGFGHLGNTLRAREAAGFISDIVKQEELKVLRGDFDKVVINFLTDYLVIEEWPADATETLAFLKATCASGDYQIAYTASGNLTQRGGDDEVIQVKPVSVLPNSSQSECPGFKVAKDTEWNYQLTNGDLFSSTLRFVHFNLQRDTTQKSLTLLSGPGTRAVIYAPYGRKRLFESDGSPKDSLILTVGNVDEGVNEQVTIQ